MCAPDRPSLDNYDTNIQVKAHFSKTPDLTPIPIKHRYKTTADSVKREVSELYRKHGFKRCPHHGLYWAGSMRLTADKDRDKTMLLVIELRGTDIMRWREIDVDARRILTKYDLSGEKGVCLRYYRYWSEDTDGDDEAIVDSEDDVGDPQAAAIWRSGGETNEWRRRQDRTTVIGSSLPTSSSPSAAVHVPNSDVEPPWLDPRDQRHMTLAERGAQRTLHYVI